MPQELVTVVEVGTDGQEGGDRDSEAVTSVERAAEEVEGVTMEVMVEAVAVVTEVEHMGVEVVHGIRVVL